MGDEKNMEIIDFLCEVCKLLSGGIERKFTFEYMKLNCIKIDDLVILSIKTKEVTKLKLK